MKDLGKLPEGVHGIIREHLLGTDGRAWIPQLKPRTPTAKLMNAMLAEREAIAAEAQILPPPPNSIWPPRHATQCRNGGTCNCDDVLGPFHPPDMETIRNDYCEAYGPWYRWKWLKEICSVERYSMFSNGEFPTFLGLHRRYRYP